MQTIVLFNDISPCYFYNPYSEYFKHASIDNPILINTIKKATIFKVKGISICKEQVLYYIMPILITIDTIKGSLYKKYLEKNIKKVSTHIIFQCHKFKKQSYIIYF